MSSNENYGRRGGKRGGRGYRDRGGSGHGHGPKQAVYVKKTTVQAET